MFRMKSYYYNSELLFSANQIGKKIADQKQHFMENFLLHVVVVLR